MLELIIGIVLGAAFHEFWTDLFNKVKTKISEWSSSKKTTNEGTVVDGEVVDREEKPA